MASRISTADRCCLLVVLGSRKNLFRARRPGPCQSICKAVPYHLLWQGPGRRALKSFFLDPRTTRRQVVPCEPSSDDPVTGHIGKFCHRGFCQRGWRRNCHFFYWDMPSAVLWLIQTSELVLIYCGPIPFLMCSIWTLPTFGWMSEWLPAWWALWLPWPGDHQPDATML